MLKIIRDLIQPELCYIELDGLKVGTIYAFEGWRDRIREAIEEREATPEEGYLLEEQGREIATLVKRLANAELLIEKLKEEVKELNFSVALHDRAAERAEAVKESLTSALRDIKRNVDDWNLQDYVTIRRLVNAALRTAEESSVVESGNQPEVITKLGKALQNTTVVKRVLVENSCPSEFGLEDCEYNPETGCSLCCEDCWNEEVGE